MNLETETPKKVVLCGSMKRKDMILAIGSYLSSEGYEVLLPYECLEGKPKTRAHFDRVRTSDIVLVINPTANGVDHYIGGNTLAEIGLGYYLDKPIYLLTDMYEPYKDELIAWGVKSLKFDGNNTDVIVFK